jgi:hypothetical protein
LGMVWCYVHVSDRQEGMIARYTTGPQIPKYCTSGTWTTASTNEWFLPDDGWLSHTNQSYMPSPPIGCWILSFLQPWCWHPHSALLPCAAVA